ncbi:MAG: UDP-N-acetylmuramoyl-tripeptide--D-alanyl-D-alanine ligase, partial [Solirubrobacteraceae bacterium]
GKGRGGSGAATGPLRAAIDSRRVEPGDLFVGLPGERVDGARFAEAALAAGAWGALVGAGASAEASREGALLVAHDPLAALQRLARAWRDELGARVIAVTGSTGKTSTKDILAALLAPHRATVASRENFNTEIGLPLAILEAPPGTEVLVLELAMRGAGQIAELTAIARPDVGVIVNVGPVHLELLGSLEAIVAAKAELLRDMPAGGTAVVPAGERLLDAHRAEHLRVVTFGEGGDVALLEVDGARLLINAGGDLVELEVSFAQAHQRVNALAAVAAARAVGVDPAGRVDVAFSAWRGERVDLPAGVVVVNDCYNANPMSMRAAVDDIAMSAAGRRVAVLGDMLELGPEEAAFHRDVGRHAASSGVALLIAVGSLASAMAEGYEAAVRIGVGEAAGGAVGVDAAGEAEGGRFAREVHVVADAGQAAALARKLVRFGDTVLVKASRGVGLEVVAEELARRAVGAR